jgi:hypothetical protein
MAPAMGMTEREAVELDLTLMMVGRILDVSRQPSETADAYRARLIAASNGEIADIKPGAVRMAGRVERIEITFGFAPVRATGE